jgi:hypothetical protein
MRLGLWGSSTVGRCLALLQTARVVVWDNASCCMLQLLVSADEVQQQALLLIAVSKAGQVTCTKRWLICRVDGAAL